MLRWILVLLVLFLSACGQSPQNMSLHGTDVTGAEISGEFTLTDHQGNRRHLEDFRGKVVVVFFGYTRCPDVCPTTMLSMANAMALLGEKARDVQVLFVTVDPERDTQDVLAQYVPSFDEHFIGLYGTAEQLKQVARNYRVVYAKQSGGDDASYTVDHTAGLYVFDREGKVRAYLRHDETPEELAQDITQFF